MKITLLLVNLRCNVLTPLNEMKILILSKGARGYHNRAFARKKNPSAALHSLCGWRSCTVRGDWGRMLVRSFRLEFENDYEYEFSDYWTCALKNENFRNARAQN